MIFACPEYNYSISAPLKNAIDWASRTQGALCAAIPHPLSRASSVQNKHSFGGTRLQLTGQLPFPPRNGKPAAVCSAAGGMGGSRAQYHLRQIGVFLDLKMISRPEVTLNAFAGEFDGATGNVTGDAAKDKVRDSGGHAAS